MCGGHDHTGTLQRGNVTQPQDQWHYFTHLRVGCCNVFDEQVYVWMCFTYSTRPSVLGLGCWAWAASYPPSYSTDLGQTMLRLIVSFRLLESNTPYAFIRCGPAQVRRGPSLALSVSWVVFRAKASGAPEGRKKSRVCEMRLRLGPGFAWHGIGHSWPLDGCVSSVAGRGGGVIHRTPSTFGLIR